MHDEQTKELRRIRITLICLLLVFLFTGGRSEVIYQDHHHNDERHFENMVPLGDGRFGVLSGTGDFLTIYEYDHETKEVKKINEMYLYELEP